MILGSIESEGVFGGIPSAVFTLEPLFSGLNFFFPRYNSRALH